MYFLALATDYDGTLAFNGRVDDQTLDALRAVKRSGRKLIMVTGREMPDLRTVFPHIDLFDLIVAENGGLLYDPAKKEEVLLAEAPSPAFVKRLHTLGVSPMSVGGVIVATWEPHEAAVLQAIRELGLDLHIIFNKGAVMVLPTNVNKASGLAHAAERLSLSLHNIVGIGDAENDLAFLNACGCSAAVANALPSVKDAADLIVADHGAGVAELATMLIENDLHDPAHPFHRQQITVGTNGAGASIQIHPFDTVLVSGSSGSGKSTLVTALIEQMRAQRFQICIVDPEGDYAELPDTVVVGDAKQEPQVENVLALLEKPEVSVVVNLLAIDPNDRPRFLAGFLPHIAKLRSETGRPHWIVLDEAHHCLPADWEPAALTLPKELPAVIAVTVHPESVSHGFLEQVSTVVGVGDCRKGLQAFCDAVGRPLPEGCPDHAVPDQICVLTKANGLELVTPVQPQEKQKRHARKYAVGELGADKSFFFRGPKSALNLRAANLATFLQLADGVDDETWLHHLRGGEYSRWFRDAIKDSELASEASTVEAEAKLSARDSRSRIREIVERRYTAPAR